MSCKLLLIGVLLIQLAQPLDTVSIVLSAGGGKPVGGFNDVPSSNISPGKLSIQNASLRDLIQYAYQLPDYRVAAGAPWTELRAYGLKQKAAFNGRRRYGRRPMDRRFKSCWRTDSS